LTALSQRTRRRIATVCRLGEVLHWIDKGLPAAIPLIGIAEAPESIALEICVIFFYTKGAPEMALNALNPEIGTALKIVLIIMQAATIASSISTVSLQETFVKTETAAFKPTESATTPRIGTFQDFRCVVTVKSINLYEILTIFFVFYGMMPPF